MVKIGICGAPGAAAAGVFYNCKSAGRSVELVQEFVREEINKGFELHSVADQFRIFMKQREREDIVVDGDKAVDHIMDIINRNL